MILSLTCIETIFFFTSIIRVLCLRAQPPEIVPKSTTTNIFGNRNEQVEDEQPVDMFPPGVCVCVFLIFVL